MKSVTKFAAEIIAGKIDEYPTPQGIKVRVDVDSKYEYTVSLVNSSGVTMPVKYFSSGKVVPDLKTEARVDKFARKLAAVLSSDPT